MARSKSSRESLETRYLDIARGSLHEVEGILELATELGYFTAEELKPVRIKRANCARLVFALMRKMEEAIRRA